MISLIFFLKKILKHFKNSPFNSNRLPLSVRLIYFTWLFYPYLDSFFQIVEPHLGEGGEVIASIPIKLSVRSVYSKYAVSPVSDINFGAMLINTKKTRVFTIENKGEFEFRYSVLKMINTVAQGRQKLGPPAKRAKSRDGSSSGRSQQDKPSKPKRADSVRGYVRLLIWPYTSNNFSMPIGWQHVVQPQPAQKY